MAPRGIKRPPAWPSADEAQSDAKKAVACLSEVRTYRATGKGEPPRINTWVVVVPETAKRGYIPVADRAIAETPALVTALTIEDGIGSAIVVYPNPLVLMHKFGGSAVVRVLVPFSRLRPYTRTSSEIRQLETKLFQCVVEDSKKKAASRGLVLESDCDSLATPVTPTKTPQGEAATVHSLEPETPADAKVAQISNMAVEATTSAKPIEASTFSGKALADFTTLVSRALQRSAESRLSRSELLTALGDSFTETEMQIGLKILDEKNKLYLCDDLVFGL